MKNLERKLKTLNGIINICRKAGYLIIGGENIKNNPHKMYLILIDKSSGNSLKREINYLLVSRNIPFLEVEGLANMIGIENCKAVAIKNKTLSDEILKMIKGE